MQQIEVKGLEQRQTRETIMNKKKKGLVCTLFYERLHWADIDEIRMLVHM